MFFDLLSVFVPCVDVVAVEEQTKVASEHKFLWRKVWAAVLVSEATTLALLTPRHAQPPVFISTTDVVLAA